MMKDEMTRREFLGTVAAGTSAMAAVVSGQAPRAPANVQMTASKPVLTQSDFAYLGYFLLPQSNQNVRFGFSNGLMTARQSNGELRFLVTGARPSGDPVYEVSYPGQGLGSAAPRANLIRAWGDVYGNRRLVEGTGAYAITWGLHWFGDQLWWAYSADYGGMPHNPSLATSVLRDDGTVASYGPWRTQIHSGMACGYMVTIPPAFASSYASGFPIAIGNPPHANNSTAPFGANLNAIQPPSNSTPADTVGSTHWTIPVKPLVRHDLSHPQARATDFKVCGWNVLYDCSKGSWLRAPTSQVFSGGETGSLLDWMDSCVWIDLPTKHGVLFLGQLVDSIAGYPYPNGETQTHLWYGQHMCCHGHDARPVHEDTGPGASTIVNYGWIYDPADFAKVIQGKVQPWDLKPNSVFRASALSRFVADRRIKLYQFGGMYFDTSSSQLFVVENVRDQSAFEAQPVIHVFRVKS